MADCPLRINSLKISNLNNCCLSKCKPQSKTLNFKQWIIEQKKFNQRCTLILKIINKPHFVAQMNKL